MPTPPTLRKVNPSDQPIIYLAMGSPTLPLPEVDKYAETLLARQLSTLNGVAQVNVYGSQKFAVRIQADPVALAARGIGIDQVATIANAANLNIPTGSLNGSKQSIVIHTQRPAETRRAFNRQIIAYQNGAPVRVQDVGRVVDSVENKYVASWYNGKRAIVLAIQRQPGSNTIAVVDEIKSILPQFMAQLPATGHARRRSTTAASRSAPRSSDVQTDAAARGRPGRGGDLRLPAHAVGDAHSVAGAADRGDRHLRRHVVPGLQPRQSVADGADAVGRLRRRRRHRHAREHRAPRRGRRAAASRPR